CGPSGSGKSTLIRCVNGLERVQAGDIVVLGDSVTRRGVNLPALRTRVGMVFQSFNLFPHMTALENIMLAPKKVRKLSHDAAEKAAKALLARVGLAEKAGNYPANLSGGQQQRVAIARALAMFLALALVLSSGAPALAQPDTLEKIKSSGVLTIGTRTGSPPFAYINKNNEWVGFSIDLVEMLVKPSVEKAVGKSIKIEKKE